MNSGRILFIRTVSTVVFVILLKFSVFGAKNETFISPSDTIIANLSDYYLCRGECTDLIPEIELLSRPATFLWSTGDTAETITVCPINNGWVYFLTITDNEGDSLVLNSRVSVAPDIVPKPSVTTPVCVGDNVYFEHPNYSAWTQYHWNGPNNFSSNKRKFIINNVVVSQGGKYSLVTSYWNKCFSDTVYFDLKVNERKSFVSTFDSLGACNFICDLSDLTNQIVVLNKDTSGGQNNVQLCAAGYSAPSNTAWLGFVAQEGNYTITIKPFDYQTNSNVEGVQFALYKDTVDFIPIICSDSCSYDDFEISSSDLEAGQDYYLIIDGCGGNTTKFRFNLEGQVMNGYCSDYHKMEGVTDWFNEYSGWTGTYNYWNSYIGDTVFNAKKYRVFTSESDYIKYFIREDVKNRKVYLYDPWKAYEEVLYDYSLQEGDFFKLPFNHAFEYYVDKIDSIQSNIGPLKRWHFTDESNLRKDFDYVEMIGGDELIYYNSLIAGDIGGYAKAVFSNCTLIAGDENILPSPLRYDYDSIGITICEGENYQGYDSTGFFIDTLINVDECLTINKINLTVIPQKTLQIDTSICPGENYLGFNTSGQFTYDSTDISTGCPMIIDINLTVLAEDNPDCSPNNIFEESKSEIKIFPNPVKNSFTILFSGQVHSNIDFGIYDVLGKAIFKRKDPVINQTMIIDARSFDNGIYFIRLKQNENTIIKKIIVNN